VERAQGGLSEMLEDAGNELGALSSRTLREGNPPRLEKIGDVRTAHSSVNIETQGVAHS